MGHPGTVRAIKVGRLARSTARVIFCWAAAIALMVGTFLLVFVVTARASYSLLSGWWGPKHHDLSDAGPAILAFAVAALIALVASLVAMLIASGPALALIGKSGILDRLLRRRTRRKLRR